MSPTSPITARLDKLHDQWVAFARDPDARILLWRAEQDELPFIDAFVARECDVEHASTPDLFMQLTTGFAREHGKLLAQEVRAQARELTDWVCPEEGNELRTLLRTLRSLRTRLVGKRSAAHLAVWLDPEAVVAAHYPLWLQRLAHAAPAALRFIVVDSAEDGGLSSLARLEPRRVVCVPCSLDVPNALRALTDQAAAGEPGNRFRGLQARLAASMAARDLGSTRIIAEQALGVANEQGWPQLAAGVQMMLAAACVMHRQNAEGVAAYQAAEQFAARYELQEPKAGKQLRLQALLGSASVQLATGAYSLAAKAYLNGASIASELADMPNELDCYRLASLCCAQHGVPERAWKLGLSGMQVALRMDAAQRAASTLPYLAQQLTLLCAGDERAKPLAERFEELLGPRWQALLAG
jgi:hypothetical protein